MQQSSILAVCHLYLF